MQRMHRHELTDGAFYRSLVVPVGLSLRIWQVGDGKHQPHRCAVLDTEPESRPEYNTVRLEMEDVEGAEPQLRYRYCQSYSSRRILLWVSMWHGIFRDCRLSSDDSV